MAFRRFFQRNPSSRRAAANARRVKHEHPAPAGRERLDLACRHVVEALEERRLLTSLQGGDIFEFVDALGGVIRVNVRGNIQLDLIGSSVSQIDNTLTLGNLPGQRIRNGITQQLNGGLNPQDAVQEIGPVGPINDPLSGPLFTTNIQALAAQADGDNYLIATRPNPNGPGTQVAFVLLGAFPPNTTTGPVAGTVVATEVIPGISAVTAADFDPGTGLLWFVGNNGTAVGPDTFFSIDVDASTRPNIENSLVNHFSLPDNATANPVLVTGITFSASGQIFGVASEQQGGNQGGQQFGNTFIFNVSTVNGFFNIQNLLVRPSAQQGGGQGGGGGNQTPQQGMGIASIEYSPLDNSLVLLPGGGTNQQNGDVLTVQLTPNPNNNVAVSLGPVVFPPPQQGQTVTGQNVTALTFNPVLEDPFTGGRGVMIGYDAGTNNLFYLDLRNRNVARNIWAIYVSQASAGSSITVGWMRQITDPVTAANNVVRPFIGNAGPIRVNPAQGGGSILVTGDDTTGQLYLGARTNDVIQNTVEEQDRPLVLPADVPSNVNFGGLPSNLTSLAPGLYSAPGTEIGKFYWGGTFTGRVDLGGSIDQFYAGWLLTGDARGLPDDTTGVNAPDALRDNFRVAGDLRNLIVKDSIGTDEDPAGTEPTYLTGFELRVGGTVGQINTEEAFVGRTEVQNLDPSDRPRLTTGQREIEYHNINANGTTGFDGVLDPLSGQTEPFLTGPTGNSPTDPRTGQSSFYNDTFETAEYLGAIFSAGLNRDQVVAVDGVLQSAPPENDLADYYGISLLAGQTVEVQLTTGGLLAGTAGTLQVGVFDPDGRLVATDYNSRSITFSAGRVFRFTPDRPGVYRFAVGNSGDPLFGSGGQAGVLSTTPYKLVVGNVGALAMGALFANGTILNLLPENVGDHNFSVLRGDLGVIESGGGAMLANEGTQLLDESAIVGVDLGNLRAIECVNIGATAGAVTNIIDFDVPNGSVGLLRATGASLAVSNQFQSRRTTTYTPIAGDFQLVDAPAGQAYATLIANRSIGVVRANSMATLTPSVFTVDADDSGRQGQPDGFLDLIDVAGDLGTISAGGPQITHGAGGDVRYIRVLGNLFQDVFFGGGSPETRTIRPNEEQTITDDSGGLVRIRPTGTFTRNPNFDPNNPAGTPEFLGTSTDITGYGIRSGGEVLVNVEVTTVAGATGGGGVEFNSIGDTPVEVSRIELIGNGTPVVYDVPRDPFGNPRRIPRNRSSADRLLRLATAAENGGVAEPLEVVVGGSAPVDILNIIADDAGRQNLSAITRVANNTPGGEIANIVARSVGEITSRGTIGLMRSSTGQVVEGLFDISMGDTVRDGQLGPDGGTIINNRLIRQFLPEATIPLGTAASDPSVGVPGAQFLNRTRNAIVVVGGNVGSVRAAQGVGNVFVQGSIGEIVANDGTDTPGMFEGIMAPVGTFSFSGVQQPDQDGRILRVDVGEGIMPGGTGDFSRAGIFGYGTIGPITGDRGAVIRGDIHSERYVGVNISTVLEETPSPVPTTLELGGVGIERITLTDGVISNADIVVSALRGDIRAVDATYVSAGAGDPVNNPVFDIGPITLNGNGGMIGTVVVGPDVGRISVDDTGFGVFASSVLTYGDGRFQGFDVGGYGIRGTIVNGGAATTSVIARGDGSSKSTASVSPSARISEQGASAPNAPYFDPFFGVEPSPLTDIHRYLGTNAAQPEIAGRTDTGIIEADDLRGERDLGTMRAWQIRADPTGVFGQTVINFANSIGEITAQHNLDGASITTGRFKTFNLGSDVFNLDLTVAGPLKKFNVAGDLGGSSVIRTTGPAGDMGKISVGGNLTGNVESSRGIKSLFVGKDFTGSVLSGSTGKQAVGTIQVNGAFVGSSLLVKGNVGKIIANDLGNFGDTLTVNGSVKQIQVNRDLRASVIVQGSLGKLTVGRSILSGGVRPGTRIDVSKNFDSLTVGADVEQGVVIRPQPKKLKSGGQFLGTYA